MLCYAMLCYRLLSIVIGKGCRLQVNHRHNVVCMDLLSHLVIIACNRFTIINKMKIGTKTITGTFGLFIDLQLQRSS